MKVYKLCRLEAIIGFIWVYLENYKKSKSYGKKNLKNFSVESKLFTKPGPSWNQVYPKHSNFMLLSLHLSEPTSPPLVQAQFQKNT